MNKCVLGFSDTHMQPKINLIKILVAFYATELTSKLTLNNEKNLEEIKIVLNNLMIDEPL